MPLLLFANVRLLACTIIQVLRRFVPTDRYGDGDMSTVATVHEARDIALKLECRERARTGANKQAIRAALARRARVGLGTWENLVRGRIKRVDAWLRDHLRTILAREIEQEITRLEHELEMVRQSCGGLDGVQIREVETHLAAARQLIDAAGGKAARPRR